jgi:hypothetical protein
MASPSTVRSTAELPSQPTTYTLNTAIAAFSESLVNIQHITYLIPQKLKLYTKPQEILLEDYRFLVERRCAFLSDQVSYARGNLRSW